MRLKLLSVFIFFSVCVFATHERGGYITYTPMGSGVYKFHIYTWTNFTPANSGSDRCDLTLFIDGTDTVNCPRINGTGPCPNGGIGVDGVMIVPASGNYGGIKENVYEGFYTLLPGMHTFAIVDPNRDANIINVPNSVSRSFALMDTLFLYNTVDGMFNTAPVVNYAPVDNACQGQPFCYNPGVTEIDGDSLDFSIAKSYEGDPNNSMGVSLMNNETIPSGITIDKHTGLLCWNSPQSQGEYVISILVREYRRDPKNCGHVYMISETILDFPVLVKVCNSTNITFTTSLQNACVVAGTTLTLQANASGATNIISPVSISAVGLPLTSMSIGNNATFTYTSTGFSASGNFNWTPSCSAVQLNPYPVTIRAFDASLPPNANYSSLLVKVISPPPVNLTATNLGTSVALSWNAPPNCNQTSGDTVQNYYVYRVDSCVNFIPSSCQTGVPANAGYLHIGTTPSSVTTFTDTNVPPTNMCTYIVAAGFENCSMSKATPGACVVTGIENNFLNENISLFPNPTTGNINLKITLQNPGNLKISISNTLGQEVFSKTENNVSNNIFEYDLSKLNRGIYFATICSDNTKVIVRKISVE